ncbi:hypothetical protein [Salinivibrio sp. ES.052]|uniref:hypothetical protein n=1 Tax=Salinivibrio sp. ES.052 TaxID=1882823 RepID=UPI00092A4E53|nr:hypothetical protein [Salinivibrio sp. ES.052]SIN79345.1 hypothetical protein SAMN05444724_0491 [Salinivibrio sp. ES.052]
MDKRLYLSLLLPLAFTGCGGGSDSGGGSKPTPKYNIDFASFYITKADQSCSIYDEKIYYEEVDPSDPNYDPDAEPEVDYRERVHARKIRYPRFRVTIHGADGTAIKTYTLDDDEWSSKGTLKIKKSKVPSDGYLTIYEFDNQGGYVNSISYQKPLLSTNMRFSDFKPNNGVGSCITSGSNGPTLKDRDQTLEDGGDSSGQVFGINTRDQNFWATSPINVEAELDSEQIMAARYERLASDTKENVNETIQQDKYRQINAFKLFKRGSISNKPLEMNEIGDDSRDDYNFWYPPLAGAGSLENTKLYVKKGGEPLFWQVLPNNSDGVYGYAHDIGNRNYYLNGQGTLNNWGLTFTEQPEDVDTGIDYANALLNIDTPNRLAATQVISCGTSETGACLQGYISGGEQSWDTQRSFIRLEDGSGREIRQVIYSKPQAMLPLLSFTGFNDLYMNSNLSKAKLSLLSADKEDALEAIINNNIDVRGVARETSEALNNPDNDGMALLNTEYERKQAQTQLRVQSHKVISATN